jgi:hypothetical protein
MPEAKARLWFPGKLERLEQLLKHRFDYQQIANELGRPQRAVLMKVT